MKVKRLSLAVPQGCLRFVIVVFPDHTHYFRHVEHSSGAVSTAFDIQAGPLADSHEIKGFL